MLASVITGAEYADWPKYITHHKHMMISLDDRSQQVSCPYIQLSGLTFSSTPSNMLNRSLAVKRARSVKVNHKSSKESID